MGRGAPDTFDRYARAPRRRAAALIKHAKQLGLEEIDLDELVHDVASSYAAEAFNAGEGPEDDAEALEELHGVASHDASEVNNLGLEAQVAYLVHTLGEDQARQALSELAGR